MSDTVKFKVDFNNRSIGLIYISTNPNDSNEKVATIIPIDRSGSWTNDDLTISLTQSVTDYFSLNRSDDDIAKEITQLAAIEPWKVSFIPVP